MTDVRKGQAPEQLTREQFGERFRQSFFDPAFRRADDAIGRLEEIAWDAYREERKSPVTAKAGPGFADPDYELPVQWSQARERLAAAQARQRDRATKTWRLAKIAEEVLAGAGLEADFLDLSLLTSEFGLRIHPCKGCVSTAQPLCHWPCSCYPNHALGQAGDGMAEIYERWAAAHAVVIVTPVHWYQAPSALKLMIDRLVCADGGNPDPTSTAGKDAAKAKALELAGWPYPKHLAGRAYGVVVHGDVGGVEPVRRALCDWLDWMGLIDAGFLARLDRYIGYYRPYATSHDELDADRGVQEEVRNVARAVAAAVAELRAGKLSDSDAGLEAPRPK
jgi:multimeric flavodoxin WrbA